MKRTTAAATLVVTLGLLLTADSGVTPHDPAPAPAPIRVATDPTPRPLETEPEPAPFTLSKLPRPALDAIIPAPQSEATLDDARAVGRAVFGDQGVAAVARPRAPLTPAFESPDETRPPILALEETALGHPAAWLATTTEGDWVRVLVPLGRGALPSADATAVNGRAVWVAVSRVTLEPIRTSVVVDISERRMTVTDENGRTTGLTVGVGREDDTDTPRGLGSLVAFAENPGGLPVAVTSMQSARLDGYDGAAYAAFALHPDPEDGAALGTARSNGCIRMSASDYAEHIEPAIPVGTPVWVVD